MKQAYIKYILALLLFGSNGIVASHISLSSYEIVFTRTLIGSIFLILIFLILKGKFRIPENKKHLVYIMISGSAMGASWMFLYEAYSQIGVSIATLVYYCGPVLIVACSPFLFRERISFIKIIGFFSVLLGMIFLNQDSFLQNGFSWGLLCGLLAALMYVFMIVFNKKAISIMGIENAIAQLSISFFVVAIFTFIKQGSIIIQFQRESIFPILLLGIINTGIGCYLYFSSIQKLEAQSVAILGYLEPVSALLFSAMLLHEHLSFIQIIGAVLILGGAMLGEFFHRKPV